MKSYRTRPVNPHEEEIYWTRANECWDLALHAASQKKWSGCTINVIHAVISLADLMCARFSGKRYAGTSHDEAISFYETLRIEDPDFRKSVARLGQILSFKTQAEYDGSAVSEAQTELILKNGTRFREYVLKKLPLPKSLQKFFPG